MTWYSPLMRITQPVVRAILAVLPVLCAAQSQSAAEVEKVFRAWQYAAEHHDSSGLERFLTDDFTYILASGRISDRKTYIDDHKPGRTLSEVSNEVLNIRVYSGTAILTERIHFLKTGESRIATRVFVKQDGVWKCAAVQQTTEMMNAPGR